MTLELLAPARNIDIGIAAINCGADAVYIAGPSFGARKAAGNSIEDIRSLCRYAHQFGARVFLTVNTIIYDNELEQAHKLMLDAQEAGIDAFIVQDLAIFTWDDIKVPLHASTQCSIRTPERAAFYEKLGCSRLVLERELSLEDVRLIRKETECELEFFVHGALCVCYSGNCYLSEYLDERSANRGDCIQACRSLYDLTDKDGRVIVKNKALLSLKDYKLISRLEELAEAGICSFKIEGRLKNASYVKNVVKAYSEALDKIVEAHPDIYQRLSFGKVYGGFTPELDKTFNRGYTSLFLDGKRGKWSSMDAPKSMGEPIGSVASVRSIDPFNAEISIIPENQSIKLSNGDGLAFIRSNAIVGVRADICKHNSFICKKTQGLAKGTKLFRNYSAAFEKEIDTNSCKRLISVELKVRDSVITALSEDGRTVEVSFPESCDTAANPEAMIATYRAQLSKISSIYSFKVSEISFRDGIVPFLPISSINALRRSLSEKLDASSCIARTMSQGTRNNCISRKEPVSYKDNIANSRASGLLSELNLDCGEKAYELSHEKDVELMRTRYCIRYELGLCQKNKSSVPAGRLFLINNGRKLALDFDCARCEMTVKEV